MKLKSILTALILALGLLGSCASIKRSAVRSVADMLSSPDGAGVITSDDDPQLIAEALPLTLKLYEILLNEDPENSALSAATGRNFVMYSGAFVQMKAEKLDDEDWIESTRQLGRAKKLYRRGRDYLLDALEINNPGFLKALDEGDYETAVNMLDSEDASTAYWAALAWLGMAGTDFFDLELVNTLDKALLLLYRSLELDESNPDLHNILIQVHLSLPSAILLTMQERSPSTDSFIKGYYALTGEEAEKRALHHYKQALSLSGGMNPSPHITMAKSHSIRKQDAEGFRNYLNKALAIDPEENPQNRLIILIYQEQAQWLLDNIELFFLMEVE